MCMKCGCGKKKGEPGFGMGKQGMVAKRVAKKTVKKKTSMVRKKGM